MIDTARLDPVIQEWLARIGEINAELPMPTDPADFGARRARELAVADTLAVEFARAVDPRVTITEVESAAGRYAHLLRPSDAIGPLPTQVFLHGGGFISGTAREVMNDAVLSERAAEANIQILSLDYRLAPEDAYPAGVEDAVAAVRMLASDPEAWQVDPSRIGVGGGSAGGHIAAVAALQLRDATEGDPTAPRLVHALLEVPALSMSPEWPSMTEFGTPEEVAGAVAIANLYLGASERDEYFDTASATKLAGLPRTLVMTAEFDGLRDGAEAYANNLLDAGVEVGLRRGAGHLHGTSGLTSRLGIAQEWQAAAIAELRDAYR